jgi:quercetin dioxygenase-like cupin family protein/acetyl esterase/lipase/phenylpyruvate tautomerase PptA (4-oxalocrotonate tautomerase family)
LSNYGRKFEQQKARLAEAITKDIMEILNYADKSVSVAMEEIEPNEWVEKVYKPIIKKDWDNSTRSLGTTSVISNLQTENRRTKGTSMNLFDATLFSFSIIFVAALVPSATSAQQLPSYIDRPPDAASVFAIYPGSGVPPGSQSWTWHEQTTDAPGNTRPNRMVRNVVIPTITMFKPPAGKATGTSLVIAPGGAFRFLMVDYEGYDMARSLAQAGVTTFVLKYRVAHTPENDVEMAAYLQNTFKILPHPGPAELKPPVGNQEAEEARTWAEEDGRQAIQFVREHAGEWGLDPHRIGIAGFSAGGGLAVEAAMRHSTESRPDFVGAIYAGYRSATPVPADAPPLFIAATDDDVLVAPISGARLYEAWHAAGKPAELHIFVKGQHGFGMKKQNLSSDAWIDLFKSWLANQGYLSPSTGNSAAPQVQPGAASSTAPATESVEDSQTIQISRGGSRKSNTGPADRFTGAVEIEVLFPERKPSRMIGGSVAFPPGARTAWHTHPLGQILIVTAGTGWVQQWGGAVQEIRVGDVVWIPAGIKHWHGATASTAMTHIAILEQLDGNNAAWMEKVTDEQYRK